MDRAYEVHTAHHVFLLTGWKLLARSQLVWCVNLPRLRTYRSDESLLVDFQLLDMDPDHGTRH